MNKDDDRIDPDELLKAIKKEETKKKSGKLKIFFGMSAGVGKTYSMLEEAQQQFKEGKNVFVGTINTHGRQETELILQGLPILPEKWIKYRETVFEELDLETILKKKPELILVDELAHTNVPGSRHQKRWQDVIEILDNGIDVYTTLNVQHLESRKDLVENVTGIQIRETVPDSILERASNIELIDISPSELLQRLKEGKVYLGTQSEVAARHFFKENTLTALREIALRFTAEKVDHDLHTMLPSGKEWKTREKLMVAISPSFYSQQLIRRTRRRAFELDAPWVVIYVDTGQPLSDQDQNLLNSHLNLAQELGAEVVITHDLDVASALQRIAKQKNITQLVLGRPSPRPLWKIFSLSMLDQLEKESKQLDLLILRTDRSLKKKIAFTPSLPSKKMGQEGLLLIISMAALTAIGFILNPEIGYRSVGFLFLLGILFLSLFLQPSLIFVGALSSALIWDYFFIPPAFSFTFDRLEDLILIFIYFCTATIIGILTAYIRKQDHFLRMREQKIENLYEIEREITQAANYSQLRLNVSQRLQSLFQGQFDLLTKQDGTGHLTLESPLPGLKEEKELAVAQWVFEHGKIAGWSTPTLPSAKGLFIPIKFSQTVIGILVYYPKRELLLTREEMNILQTTAQQLGVYLERYLFEERLTNQAYMSQVEKLHVSVLRSISHRFYTPLNQILKAKEELSHLFPENEKGLPFLNAIERGGRHLQMMIDHFLSSAEIESGFIKLDKTRQNMHSFLDVCVEETKILLEKHSLILSLPPSACFLLFDSRLMKMAIKNLLLYAALLSPLENPIKIEGIMEGNLFKISLFMEGVDISVEKISALFSPSYSLHDIQTKEREQGLVLVKAVIEIHQGQIEVKKSEQGVLLRISLPS